MAARYRLELTHPELVAVRNALARSAALDVLAVANSWQDGTSGKWPLLNDSPRTTALAASIHALNRRGRR